VRAHILAQFSLQDCVSLLKDLDRRLNTVGETTAVVTVLSNGQVWGASVGDSSAWLVVAAGVVDPRKTRNSSRFSGRATPFRLDSGASVRSAHLVGSDVSSSTCRTSAFATSRALFLCRKGTAALVAAARLRSGALRDDIAVIALANKALQQTGLSLSLPPRSGARR